MLRCTVLPSSISEHAYFVTPALLPVAFMVAILRYRLYEIDRLISRTVSYTVVLVVLAAVYVGALAQVLPPSSDVGVAAATLAAVAAADRSERVGPSPTVMLRAMSCGWRR